MNAAGSAGMSLADSAADGGDSTNPAAGLPHSCADGTAMAHSKAPYSVSGAVLARAHADGRTSAYANAANTEASLRLH